MKNIFWHKICQECLSLITSKNVDIDELSFQLGVSKERFMKYFNKPSYDLTFYLKTYNLLIEWRE